MAIYSTLKGRATSTPAAALSVCLSVHPFSGLLWRLVIFIEHLYILYSMNKILFNSHSNSGLGKSRSKFCGF